MAKRRVQAGEAFVKLLLEDRDFAAGIAAVSRRLRNAGQSIATIGAGLFAGAAGVGAAFTPAIAAASDLQETMNKFDVVFGQRSAEVKAWGDQFASTVGRSKKQVADFLGSVQDLVVPIGFEADEAEKISKVVTGLAVDLASFNNIADDAALRDLQAALTGSGEVMKKYGVIVSEAAVKQRLINDGIDPRVATDQQKVFARLNIILDGTTAAQGDAIRSADSYANSIKRLRANASDLAAAIGGPLLESLAGAATYLSGVVGYVEGWVTANPQLIKSVAAVVAGVGAAGAALVAVGTSLSLAGFALGGLSSILGVVGGAFAAVVSPIGLVVSAVGIAAVAFFKFTEAGQETTRFIAERFRDLFGVVSDVIDAMARAISAGDIKLAADVLWTSLEVAWQTGTTELFSLWVGMIANMKAAMVVVTRDVQNYWQKIFKYIKAGFLTLNPLLSAEELKEALIENDRIYQRGREKRNAEADQVLLQIDRVERAQLKAAEDKLADATQAWEDALGRAQELPEAQLGDLIDKSKFDLPSLAELIGGASDAIGQAVEKTTGTFSGAAALQIFGNDDIEEKQLDAAKAQLKELQSVNATLATLGATFI